MGERNPSEPAEPAGGTGAVDHDRRHGTGRYSVPEVARALGISERAVRKRITVGTLDAEKVGPAWSVSLPAGPDAEPGAVPAAPGTEPAVPADPSERGAAVPGGTDLRPLADLIADLTGQVRQLSEAATVWQVRALQAEERLKALGSGDSPDPDAPTASPQLRDGAPVPEPDAEPPAPWWRFWERLK